MNETNKQYAIDEVTQCWEWTGELDPTGEPVRDGTGAFVGRKVRARTSVYREKKEVVPGTWVFSDCGNKQCVNPEHQVARLPTPEEQLAFHEQKQAKTAERVERHRAELLKMLPRTLDQLKAYTKIGTTKINGEPCWKWFGTTNKYGYPVLPWVDDDGKACDLQVVHQVLEAHGKPRPSGTEEMVVRRNCKDKTCINPEHLQWVSKASMFYKQRRWGAGRS